MAATTSFSYRRSSVTVPVYNLFVLLFLVLLALSCQSCYGLKTFGLNIHHKFSDPVKGILGFDEVPEKGSVDYYRVLVHGDHLLRGRHLAADDQTTPLTFYYGNETLQLGGIFGYLHYANISVGTPSSSYLVALDTGSDLFWLPCDCISCESSSSLGYYIDDYDGANITSQTLITSCYCGGGFRGNPYLKEGCQDINECAEYKYPCGEGYGSTCKNTYGDYECSYRQKSILIGIGSAIGALVLLFGTWGLYKVIKKRKDIKRKRKFFKRNGGLLLQQQISANEGKLEKKLFSLNVLKKATDNFSKDRILGQGGQGTVYKGMLEDGKIVAIKRSKMIDDEAQLSEFINEVVILSQINHRNVVQLLGCCLETEVPLLVYEFIPNGTLSAYIHERNEEFSFTWKMRLGIAAEVAGALSYLHSAASFPIYHRDIKSTNILLDEKYRAKVADFGTSRTISLEQTHVTTLVYGTFGYLDPEYFQSGQFTDKSDVYSFGVVLVELLTGQRAVSIARSEEGRNLATYFSMSMDDHESLCKIVDAQVIEDAPKEEIIIVANLAHRCLNLNGRNRPTMKEVATELEGIQKSRTTTSISQQNYDEVEYVRTELIEPWDSGSTSTISALENTTTRTSFRQELPLLSFGSC